MDNKTKKIQMVSKHLKLNNHVFNEENEYSN